MMSNVSVMTVQRHKVSAIFIAAWLLFAFAYLMAGTGRAEASNCSWTGVSSTDWSLSSNWTGCAGGTPGATDAAQFGSSAAQGAVLTADASVDSIQFFSNYVYSLSLQSFTLTVGATGIDINGAGAINLDTGTLVNNGILDSVGNLNLGSGTLIVNGAVSIHGATATVNGGSATIDLNGNFSLSQGTVTSTTGSFTVSGDWKRSGGTFVPGTGTITFDGTADQVITSTGSSFYGLTVNKASGTLSLGDALSASSTLTATAGTLSPGSKNVTTGGLAVTGGTFTGGSGALDVNGDLSLSSGTLTAPSGSFTVSGDWSKTGGGTFTPGTGTVTFDGSGDQVITSTGSSFYGLTVNKASGILSLGDTLSVGSTLTSTAGTFSPGSNNVVTGGLSIAGGTVTGGTGAVVIIGDVTLSGGTLTTPSGSFKVSGNWTKTGGTFTPGSNTVTFDGTAAGKTITPGGAAFNNLTINSITFGAWTVSGSLAVSGTLTVANGTLTTSSSPAMSDFVDVTLTGGTLVQDGDVTVSGNWNRTGGTFTPATYNVTFDGAATQTITSTGASFAKLTVNKASGTLSLGDALIAFDVIATAGTFSPGSKNVTAGGLAVTGGTFTGGTGAVDLSASLSLSSGTLIAPSGSFTVAGDWSRTGGTFTPATYAVTFDGTGSQSITSTGSSFYGLTVNKASGTLSLGDTLSVGSTLTATAGTFSPGSSNVAVFGLVINGGTFTGGGGAVTCNGLLVSSGIFTGGSGTLDVNGELQTSGGTFSPGAMGVTAGSLFIWGGSTFNGSTGAVDVTGNVLLGNGTLIAPSGAFTVGGNWDRYPGGFTPGTNTVTFNGTGDQTFTSVGGDFYGLVVNKSGGTFSLGDALSVLSTFTNTAGTFSKGSKGMTVGGLAIEGGTFSGGTGSLDVNGNVTISGGSITAPFGTTTVSGDWTLSGGSFAGNSGTVTFDGSGARALSGTNTFFNLTVNKSDGGSVTSSGGLAVTGTLTVSGGTFTSASDYANVTLTGGTFVLAADITVSGNWNRTGGTFTPGTFSATFDGADTQTITSLGSSFYGLIVNKSGILSLSDALSVSSTLTATAGALSPGAQNVTAGGLAVNGGTFTGGSGAVTSTSLIVSNGTFTGGSGAFDVNGDVTLSGGTLTAPSGSFAVSGNWNRTGGTFTPGTNNTVTFDGAGSQTITSSGASFEYVNVAKSGGTLSLGDALSVSRRLLLVYPFPGILSPGSMGVTAGELQIDSGVFTGGTGTVAVGGNLFVTAGAVFTGGSGMVNAGLLIARGTFTGGSGTVNAGGLIVDSGPFTAGSGALNVSGSVSVNGTFTGGTGNVDVNGNVSITNGTLTAPSGSFSVAGNWSRTSGTFIPGSGTVTFDGTASGKTITTGGQAFNNLTVNGVGGAWTVVGSLTVNGTLTVANGTLTTSSDFVDVNLTGGALVLAGNATVSGNWVRTGGTFTPGTYTVTFDGIGAQTITSTGASFYGVTVNKTTGALSLGDALTVNGPLEISGGTFAADAMDVTAGGLTIVTATFTGGSGAVDVNGNLDIFNGSTFSGSTGTVDVNGNVSISGSSTLTAPSGSFTVAGDLSINSGGTFNGSSGTTVDVGGLMLVQSGGTFTGGSGTVDVGGDLSLINGSTFSGSTGTVNVTGNVSIASTATLTAPSGSFTVAGNWSKTGGTFTPGSGTVTFDGTASGKTIATGGAAFNNLTINGIGGAWTVSGSLTVNGTLTVANGTLTTSSDFVNVTLTGGTLVLAGNATVSGNWNRTGGTFTPGTRTVTFDGTGDQTITGTNTFFNLTQDKASGGVNAVGGDQTISGTLSIISGAFTTDDDLNAVNIGVGGTLSLAGDISVNGDWNNDGVLTQNGYQITFAGGGTLTITGDTEFDSLNVASGTTLTLSGTLTVFGDFIIGGTMNAGTDSTVTLSGSGASVLSGTLTFFNLTINKTPGSVTASGSLTVNGALTILSGTFTSASDYTDVYNFGTLVLAGDITVSGDWENGGTFTPGSYKVTFDGSANQSLSGTLNFFDLTVNNSAATLSDAADVESNASVTVTGALTVTDGQFQPFTGSTFVSVSVGTNGILKPAGGASVSVSGDMTNSGTFTHNSSTVTFNGSGAQANSGTLGFFNLTINNSAASPTSTSVTMSGSLTVGGTLTVTDGQFEPPAGSDFVSVTIGTNGLLKPASGANINVSGNWTNGGTFTSNSGEVAFDGTATGKTITPGGAAFNHLTINGVGGAWTVSGNLTVSGTLTVQNGTLTTSSSLSSLVDVSVTGGTLVLGSDVNVSGNWSKTGGIFTPSTYTVTFDGTEGQTITSTGASFYGIIVNKSGTLSLGDALFMSSTLMATAGTFSPGSKNVMAGGLAINGGTFTGGVGNLDVNGNVAITSGALTAPGGSFTVSGDWSKTGGTFGPNGGTVTFDGVTTGHTIAAGGQAFYDLTINGAGGAWTVGDALSIANDLNVTQGTLNTHSTFVNVTIAVTGTLALLDDATVSGNFSNSGTFTPNGYNVTFNGSGTQNLTANVSTVFADLAVSSSVILLETVEAANASYTGTLTNLGTIRKIHAITGAGSHTSNLTKATVNVTAQGTLTTTQVDRIDSDHPSATPGLQYGKYWNITPSTGAGGYTVDLTMPQSVASDTLARVCRYTGAGTQWECGRTSSTSTTVTRTGITQLSAWTTGDPMPDLTVVKAESGDPIMAGNNMAYTISLTNNGLDSASGVALTDTLPSGVNFVSVAPSQGSCTGTSVISCALGNMDVAATSTVVITINPPLSVIPGGNTIKTIFNLAIATENETDTNVVDNTSSVGTTIIRATPGTQTATFTAQWFAGTLNVDTNGNATLTDTTDTLNVALSDVNSDGVYDQLDLSFNNAAYGEGALTDTTVSTGANDERTTSTGPTNMAMGVHPAFAVTRLANPGNTASIQDVSIQQKSWYMGQFTADLNANATLTDTTDVIAFVLVDTDSNGLYKTIDVSTNNATFGQGALTDTTTSISAGNDERLTASGNVTLGSYYLFNIAWDTNPTSDADDARITAKTHFEGSFTFDADGNGVLNGTSNLVYYGMSDLNSDALYDTIDLALGVQDFADGALGDKVVKSLVIGSVDNDEQLTDAMASLQRTLAVGDIPLALPYSALYSWIPNPGLGTNAASQLLLTTGSTPQAYVSLTSIVIDADGDHVADDHVFFALSDSNSDAILDTMDISIGDLVFGEGNLTDGVVDFNATNNSNDERIGLGSSPVTSFPRVVKLGTHYFSVTFNPAVSFTTDDASFTALWYVGTFPVDVNNDLYDETISYVLLDDNSDGLYNVMNIDANYNGSYGADEVFRAAGDRWFKPKELDGLPENVGQYTSIAQYQESNVFISYYDVDNGDLLFVKSTDGGDNFGSPVVVAGSGDAGKYSRILALDAATLVLSYHDATNGDLKAARSTDGGATWASVSVDTAGDVGQFTSMAVAQGLTTTTLYLAYYDATTNNGALKLAKSTDQGQTWPTVTQVDDGAAASNNVGQYAAITVVPKATSVAGDQDDLFISYYDATNGDLWMAKSTNEGSTWTKTLRDATGDVGRYTSIAAVNDTTPDDGHTVFISYYDAGNGDLKFVRTTDSGATTMTPVTLDSSGDVGSYASLAANEQSTVFIAYYDATNTRLKSIRSTNWGVSFDAPVEVDDGGAVGQYASLAAHDTTDLYTAYYKVVESTKGQLRFAKSNILADFRSHRINVDWSVNPTEGSSTILLDGRILNAPQLNKDQWLFVIPKNAVTGPNIEQTQIRVVVKAPNDAAIGYYTVTLHLEQVP